ncbi:MAG: ATP-binding protein [Thermodesulfobacteriota bacterium]
MIISVASGKGGTGKTTVAVGLALSLADKSAERIQFIDCDVEEPNAFLFLKPEISHSSPVGLPIPKIDYSKCTFCGKCAEVCAYKAIAVVRNQVLLFPELCHGCGACTFFCPEKAVAEEEMEIGKIDEGSSGRIEFLQGRLNIGEPKATPLIRALKGRINPHGITIIDVPPGTSCQVIESVKGSDFSLLVTEPTPFGLNDLILAVETIRKLRIPLGVIINRDGIGDNSIDEYCEKENIPILMRIPMDRNIAIAYSKGIPVIQVNSHYKNRFHELYQKIFELSKKDMTEKELKEKLRLRTSKDEEV